MKKFFYIALVLIGSVVVLDLMLESYILARRVISGDSETFHRYQFGSHAGFEEMARALSKEDGTWKAGFRSLVNSIDTNGQELTTLTTDGEGFRKSCCAAPAPAKRRILVLGGSTVMGIGSDDAHTIPSYLNRLGHDRGWVFRNLGIAAYGSTEELLTLTLALRDGERPDDVIFYNGFNDIYTVAVGNGLRSQNTITVEKIIRSTPAYLYQKYLRNTGMGRFLRRLGFKDGSNPPDDMVDTASMAVEVADLMERNRETAIALGKAYGFHVYHFLQPMMATDEEAKAGLLNPYLKQLYERHLTPAYRALTQNTRDALLQNGGWVDLTRTFVEAGEDSVYFDKVHVGPRGNELIAQKIFERLLAETPSQ